MKKPILITALMGISVLYAQSLLVQSPNKQDRHLTLEQWINLRHQPVAHADWVKAFIETEKGTPTGNFRLIGDRMDSYSVPFSSWVNNDSTFYSYDATNGLNDLVITRDYNTSSSSWENYTRMLYSYTPEGWQSQYILQLWNGSAWVNNGRGNTTYNAQGGVTEEIYYVWNGSAWVQDERYTYVRDANNQIEIYTYLNWDDISSSWEPVDRTYYSYLNIDQLAKRVYQNWNGSNWVTTGKDTSMYNASNIEISYQYFSWNNVSGIWENNYKDTTTFEPPGKITQSYSWNGSAWVNSSKYIYTLNAAELITQYIMQTWDLINLLWKNSYRYTYNFDANQNEIYSQIEIWDDINSTWKNSIKNTSAFNTDNYILSGLTEAWDNGTMSYYNLARKFYRYETNPFFSIADNSYAVEFELFPNPSTNLLFVRINLENKENLTVKLFNLQGKEMSQQYFSDISGKVTLPISVESLHSGIYVIQIQTSLGIIQQKLIKN